MSRRTFRQAFGAAAGDELGRGLGRLAVLGVVGALMLIPWLISEYCARRELVEKIRAEVDSVKDAANRP